MRWKTKVNKCPQHLSARQVTKFAWLPVKCSGAITVWLECYMQEQMYIKYASTFGEGSWQPTGTNFAKKKTKRVIHR